MGEIADSLIDGEFDYITGEYIGPGCGYPRTRIVQRKSENLSWKKVTDYLERSGFKKHRHPELVKLFGVPYSGGSPLRNACFSILKDFDRFKKFVNRLKELEDESKAN
jgi:hypothetical protein